MAALAATQGWQEAAARAGARQPGRASGEEALVTSQPSPILHSRGVARYGRAEEGAMAKIDASSSLRTMEMWLLPFAAMFTRPSWLNAVALATGALLCLNRRTVCAALRAVDGSADKGFSRMQAHTHDGQRQAPRHRPDIRARLTGVSQRKSAHCARRDRCERRTMSGTSTACAP